MPNSKIICDWYQAATQSDSPGGEKLSPQELDEFTLKVSQNFDGKDPFSQDGSTSYSLSEQSCYRDISSASPISLYTEAGIISFTNEALVHTALVKGFRALPKLDTLPNGMSCVAHESKATKSSEAAHPGVLLQKGDVYVYATPVRNEVRVNSLIKDVNRQFSEQGFHTIYQRAKSACSKMIKLPDLSKVKWVNDKLEATCDDRNDVSTDYRSCAVQQLYRDSFGKDPTAGGKLLSKELLS